jgi:nucleoside-diphosphate-sugar epimerase
MGEANRRSHRVLVTGATEPLARQLVHSLYHDDRVEFVIGVSRSEKPYYFRGYDRSRFVYRQVNILKARELSNLFLSQMYRDAEIDAVVHMAFIDRPEAADMKTHVLNVEGTKNLLDRCIDEPRIGKFIFRSADSVYKVRPHNPVLLDEDADLNFDPGASQWVRDRVDADMLCRARMGSGKLKVVVLRCGPIIGRNSNSELNRFLESWFVLRVAGYDPMVRPVHSIDVLRALKLAIERDVEGCFNVAGPDVAPLSEFVRRTRAIGLSVPSPLYAAANRLERVLGLTRYNYRDFPDGLKHTCMLDTRKAEEFLGFKATEHIKFD